jgi:long-chain acyl-CoA synthetase
LKTVAEIEAELIAPGGAFEITEEEVLGERIPVFKQRNRSLREIFDQSINHADNEYIVCEGQRYSFAQHHALVCSVAQSLQHKYDVKKGDRVAILADNHPQWIITFWATVSIGAICVGLNGWWSREEISVALRDAQPKLLVGDRKRLARIAKDDPQSPVEYPIECPTVCIEDDFESLHQATVSSLPDCEIAEDDPALILYTSGTTGSAKGALISHRALITFMSSAVFSGFRMMMMELEAGKSSGNAALPHCGLFSAPLFHLSGLFTGVVTSLAVGMKTVWTLGPFDPKKVLALIEKEKVTTWPSLGSMAAQVLDHPSFDQFDVSSVSRLGSGGAPTSPALQARMTGSFSGTGGHMALGYGLTESAGVGTHNWGELLAQHPNSVGRVFPAIQMSIRDQDNRALPNGQQGEICIRGSCVMLEYWRRPEATAAAIAPGRWLRTGDIGYFEGEFLYINTRARDLILRNAENIYPVEVEHCLEMHPAVAEAAVFGVTHGAWGQAVKASVVVASGSEIDEAQLRDFCRTKIAAFKIPSQWDFRSASLPRNAAGKVQKNVLAGDAENSLNEE